MERGKVERGKSEGVMLTVDSYELFVVSCGLYVEKGRACLPAKAEVESGKPVRMSFKISNIFLRNSANSPEKQLADVGCQP